MTNPDGERRAYFGRNLFFARGTQSFGRKAQAEWDAMTDEGREVWMQKADEMREEFADLPPELKGAVNRDALRGQLKRNDAEFRHD